MMKANTWASATVAGTPPGCDIFPTMDRWCRSCLAQPPANRFQASGLPEGIAVQIETFQRPTMARRNEPHVQIETFQRPTMARWNEPHVQIETFHRPTMAWRNEPHVQIETFHRPTMAWRNEPHVQIETFHRPTMARWNEPHVQIETFQRPTMAWRNEPHVLRDRHIHRYRIAKPEACPAISRWLREPRDRHHRIPGSQIPDHPGRGGSRGVENAWASATVAGTPPGCDLFPTMDRWCRSCLAQPPANRFQASGLLYYRLMAFKPPACSIQGFHRPPFSGSCRLACEPTRSIRRSPSPVGSMT